MNAETPKPQPPREINRADVIDELSYRFKEADPDNAIAWVLDELAELDILRFRERADDPTRDPVWTVRTVEPKPPMAATSTVVKFADEYWLYAVTNGNGYGRLDWSQVRESTVIGQVPGTPAAEAAQEESGYPEVSGGGVPYPPLHVDNEAIVMGQYYGKHDREPARRSVRVENTPHGLSISDRQKVADLLVAGKPAEAVATAHTAGLDYPAADAYVRQMPEYETYLNHHGKREPCVFRAVDGETVEEPPDWVEAVEDKHGDRLRREGDGWIGAGGEGYPLIVKPWENHYLAKYAPYTEVV